MDRDDYDAIIDAEFSEEDDGTDAICIQVELVDLIGRAIATHHGENYDAIEDIDDGNVFEDEGWAVLAALVDLGYVRRADFIYDDAASPHVRRTGPA